VNGVIERPESLSTAIGLSLDDEFVAGGHEPVDGGLGEQYGTTGMPRPKDSHAAGHSAWMRW